jgi:FkbM family methyltransferase
MEHGAKKNFGYQPSLARKMLRAFCKFIIFIFRLNGRSKISNEFMQMLDPKFKTQLDGRELQFRTGNGRLLWRAKTLLTEEPLMISWIKAMNPNDVVLDVGANVGMYTVPIAQRTKMVYACELDPLNVAILKENIVLNGVQQIVTILPFACGGSAELVDVAFRDLAYGDALQLIAGGEDLGTRLEQLSHTASIVQFSLDEIFTQLNLSLPNKVKIDVDGNEAMVLLGMKNILAEAHEVYFEDSLSDSCNEITQYLINRGFYVDQSLNGYSKNNVDQVVLINKIFKK